jgi:hypothetical protein
VALGKLLEHLWSILCGTQFQLEWSTRCVVVGVYYDKETQLNNEQNGSECDH